MFNLHLHTFTLRMSTIIIILNTLLTLFLITSMNNQLFELT